MWRCQFDYTLICNATSYCSSDWIVFYQITFKTIASINHINCCWLWLTDWMTRWMNKWINDVSSWLIHVLPCKWSLNRSSNMILWWANADDVYDISLDLIKTESCGYFFVAKLQQLSSRPSNVIKLRLRIQTLTHIPPYHMEIHVVIFNVSCPRWTLSITPWFFVDIYR